MTNSMVDWTIEIVLASVGDSSNPIFLNFWTFKKFMGQIRKCLVGIEFGYYFELFVKFEYRTQSSLNIFAQNHRTWQKARNNHRTWFSSNIFRFVPSSSLYLAVQTSQVQKHYAILKKVLGWSHVTHIIFLVLMPSPRSAPTQTRCNDRKCNLILRVSVFQRRGLKAIILKYHNIWSRYIWTFEFRAIRTLCVNWIWLHTKQQQLNLLQQIYFCKLFSFSCKNHSLTFLLKL